jgi:KUP system potassium uptake protein
MHGMIVLGSVVLCITGGEALYADLGHFGRSPIRFSWLAIAFPSLLCNYFGQGALLLTRPNLAINPFYGLVPKDLLYPMVAIATIATVIASQALISGVFSLTRQAIQLGYIPRMRILHTSIRHSGQIYISKINYALMLACIGIVLYFRSSSHLAAAYGIAVTATMCITTIIYFFVVTYQWQWPLWKSIPPIGIFLFFDLTYFTTNLLKVFYGGWFTLIVAALIVIIMATWKDGRMELSKKLEAQRVPLDVLLDDLKKHDVHRVNGTAVFMTLSPIGIPSTLLHHLKHNKVLHEKIVLLSIQSVDVPYIQSLERIKTEKLEQGFFRIIARYGFMESPNVPDIMELSVKEGLPVDKGIITYYLGRETLITTGPSKMMRWRKSLFSFLSRNAQTPAYFFGIPPGSVVEIGTQVML